MRLLGTAMWASLGLIAWTHAGYPLAAAAAASRSRFRPRPDGTHLPSVALVIAAHDEEEVIGARLDNALALDYPRDRLEVVVALDGSTDGTRAIAEERGATVVEIPRAGKVAAQNAAVASTDADVLAFSDANSMWAHDALRKLVRHFADPSVAYVCGRLALVDPESGDNVESRYWRYELWLREQESRLGSVTAGNGAIYAVRRSAYLPLGPQFSHDLAFPFRLRRAGLRALYEPEAVATEPAAASTAAEWDRKVRMLSRAWTELLHGGLASPAGQPRGYYAMLVSHRLIRYASGLLHLLALACALATRSRAVLALHAAWVALAAAGSRGARNPPAALAWYYLVVTAASVAGLARLLRRGPQATWTPAEGTR
jgi:cellulose synthase/poly-beta-1,6-N-acetylglucosamine synthase-like glycosyltransferase